MNNQLLQAYLSVTDAIAQDALPEAAYRAVEKAINDLIGHRLFTILVRCEGGEEVERVYSSQPEAYPVRSRVDAQADLPRSRQRSDPLGFPRP
jgi:hypothetical protein